MKSGKFSLSNLSFLIISTIVICLTLAFGFNPVMAQEQVLSTLTVTGQGIERIPTTLTQVQLGVEIENKTAQEVQQEIAERTSAVVDLLRQRQVEKLETTGINLRPNYKYDGNNQRSLVGYVGTNTVSFRLPTEQVGNILDEAVKVGATRIDNISFTATDEAVKTAKKAALAQATGDAQQQADAVLDSLNLNAKKIISIQLDRANPPQPVVVREQALSSRTANDAVTPVIGGEQTVRASVTLQITY